jgi:hypothetical protein
MGPGPVPAPYLAMEMTKRTPFQIWIIRLFFLYVAYWIFPFHLWISGQGNGVGLIVLISLSVFIFASVLVSFVRSTIALWIFAAMVVVIPLLIFGGMDFLALRSNSWMDLIFGTLLQMALPLLVAYWLLSSPSVRTSYTRGHEIKSRSTNP